MCGQGEVKRHVVRNYGNLNISHCVIVSAAYHLLFNRNVVHVELRRAQNMYENWYLQLTYQIVPKAL